ncbi:MAG: type II toxin-antitoxin system VapC family toxin, partial [Chloroflexi bacterium]|nr:type II toxin-antitoxin system VapC family toxin [Chloroflexota bacterium]
FLKETNMIVIPFTEAHYETAVSAWLKFGKGRHAAKLNFGDCMTYATAKLAGMPLLFIGDDFSQTDLTLA